LADRFPRRVLVWPVRVQGEGAAAEIAAAIRGFNALNGGRRIPQPDLIIVARGGGSLEDLWSFNEEIVVRAAADSMIPLISAVGHETDFTLIDFAADKRAPTPTAAAEMAVPVRADLMLRVGEMVTRKAACWMRFVDARRKELRAAARALPNADALLAPARQRLDGAADRLPRALRANAQLHVTAYSRIAARLVPHILRSRVERDRHHTATAWQRAGNAAQAVTQRRRERFSGLAARLGAGLRANVEAQRVYIARCRERTEATARRATRALRALILQRTAMLDTAGQLLDALSYRGVLARGFALIRDTARQPLRSATAVRPGLALEIEFADGRVGARAEGAPTTFDPPRMTRTRAKRGGDPGQGNLFG
jgi:exodeoxyribonuclease VII large subunit